MTEADETTPGPSRANEGDGIRRLMNEKGLAFQTLHSVTAPATTIISNLFFEGTDFIWCTEGAVRIEFSTREPLLLNKGEFLVTFPNRFVTIVGLEPSNTLRGGTVVGEANEEFFLRLGFWDCFLCRNDASDSNLNRLQTLLDQRNAGDDKAEFALLHYTSSILRSVIATRSSGHDAYFYDAIRKINTNFLAGNVSIKSLYAQVGCSPTHLIKIFKTHGLHGPSEYLYRLQSYWACRLLNRTHLTIGRIAEVCGFSSTTSFNRFFKHWMGVSPADVRRGKPYRRRSPDNAATP